MIERRLRIAILIYLWGALVEDTSLFLMAWLHPAVWFQLFHGVAPTGLDVGSGFQSLAQLHNNLITGALTVTPVLYGPDGTSLALDPLTLPPLGNVTLDIGNEAATKGWSKYQTGSVVFQYRQNHSGALGAEVYVENRAQSLSFYDSKRRVGATFRNAECGLLVTIAGRRSLRRAAKHVRQSGRAHSDGDAWGPDDLVGRCNARWARLVCHSFIEA